jgi:mono/diheme cytochrome c family protein
MFYNGFGRGDFGKFLMASNLLTVSDTNESAEVNSHMTDVLAYIRSLNPPKYPGVIDAELASRGRIIFNDNCSACHGTYGENWTYPNLLIPQSVVKTDPYLHSSNYSNPQFINWFNSSWFSKGDDAARLEPFSGYIAPPLDGIWITAPYLHNGSVPTVEAVLNSKGRPRYWSRSFNDPSYNYQQLGWNFTELAESNGRFSYNTTLPGYGNQGHEFGDHLTAQERKAVIEYLKTL